MHAHLAGDVGKQLMAVIEFDTEHGIGKALDDRAFHEYCVFFSCDDSDFPFEGWVRRTPKRYNSPDARQQEANARKQLAYSRQGPSPTLKPLDFACSWHSPHPQLVGAGELRFIGVRL